MARLGGDEFAIIYRKEETDADLLVLGENLCELVRQPCVLAGNKIDVAASLGWCAFPKDGTSVSDLLRKSDFALYQSKTKKGGQPVIFSESHETKILRQSQICLELESLDIRQNLFVNFQPIHETKHGHIIAFEALARWQSDTLGAVSPDEFIPLAEKIGCISKLTKILLGKALSVARTWPDTIGLHFNLSGIDLGKPRFIRELIDMVEGSGMAPESIVFEVTETAIIDNLDNVSDVFECLDKAGLKLALDDFGVGYSSLSYLTQIPVKILKVDKSFTEHLKPNTVEETILKTIQFLCRGLNIECIVEGVEHVSQYQQLQSLGLENMQGYIFSRPLGHVDLAAYILKNMINPTVPRLETPRYIDSKWA